MKQTGPARRLIPHMLQGATLHGITELILRSILHVQQAKIQRRKGEKSVSKRTLVWSVIVAEFPDLDVEEQTTVFINLMGKDSQTLGKEAEVISDELTSHVLKQLPFEEVQCDFGGLKDRVERVMLDKRFEDLVTRQRGEQAKKEFATPPSIKALKPAAARTVLCMDRPNGAFEAYFPGGQPTKSVSCGWRAEGRSVQSALNFCLDYLWGNHERKGGEAWLWSAVVPNYGRGV